MEAQNIPNIRTDSNLVISDLCSGISIVVLKMDFGVSL